MGEAVDAVVIGSGPNGLAAAITLAEAGYDVRVLERAGEAGGSVRTTELTLPGFRNDVGAATHPLGLLSPFFRSQDLEAHGLGWATCDFSVAHPLDDQPAPWLNRSIEETAAQLGVDAEAWMSLFTPLSDDVAGLFEELLTPPRNLPRRWGKMLRFARNGLGSARSVADRLFRGDAARALFAGNAGHSILPLTHRPSAAFGLMFSLSAHAVDWPCAVGGSGAITSALVKRLEQLGGRIECGVDVRSPDDLPPHRVALYDLTPKPFAKIMANRLPQRYLDALRRYRYGPGSFKLDYALSEPIPWRDESTRRAATVHVGGTFEEIERSEGMAWNGEVCDRPFVIVCQQSAADGTRAPEGRHTGYAYCHVPAGCTTDLTEAIENQIERFAPGFRDVILDRHKLSPQALEAFNPNLVGGAVAGGAATLWQSIFRPVPRYDLYSTPDRRTFLCSASTPPGGGVHGMCGYNAARSAMRALHR